MLHNPVARADSGNRSVTRLRAIRLGLVLVVLVVVAAVVVVTQTGTSSPRAAVPVRMPVADAPVQPYAFSGPSGRVRLDEVWEYRSDPHDRGLAHGWPAGRWAGRAVHVPYVPNAWPVTGRRGLANFNGTIGWYRTRFRVATTRTYAIRFESVHHRATVWVDGKRVASHTGAYMPFEAHTALRAGREHTLVVRADFRDPLQMKRDGWHRGWFNFGGINREVTIRPLGRFEVSSPTVVTTLRDDGAAIVDVSARVVNDGARGTLRLAGSLARAGLPDTDFTFRAMVVGAGAAVTEHRRLIVQHPALWSPAQPRLYELRLSAGADGGWQTDVGLRQLTWKGARLRVNGHPVVLYGASIHEDAKRRGDGLLPSDDDAIVARLERIGANATRALHPLSPVLLERLDRAGILVWQQVGPFDSPGNWIKTTAAKRRVATKRVEVAVDDAQTHPSVLTWAVANEVGDNGHPGGQVGWIDRTARALHARDPSRPVAIDIWGTHIPHHAGPMYRNVDLIGATSYIGWYESPFGSAAHNERLMRGRVALLRRVFPHKPLVITEFGAEANAANASASRGGFGYQSRLIAQHLRTYGSLPQLDGMLIWNLSDFALTPAFGGGSIGGRVKGIRLVRGLNQKGLFDYSGHAKPAARAAFAASASVRAANATAAAGG